MLVLILLIQVSWVDPYEKVLIESTNAIEDIEVRNCVIPQVKANMQAWRSGTSGESLTDEGKLTIFGEFAQSLEKWTAGCERTEILRRLKVLEVLVLDLIANQ